MGTDGLFWERFRLFVENEIQLVGRVEAAVGLERNCLRRVSPDLRPEVEAWFHANFPGLLEALSPEG